MSCYLSLTRLLTSWYIWSLISDKKQRQTRHKVPIRKTIEYAGSSPVKLRQVGTLIHSVPCCSVKIEFLFLMPVSVKSFGERCGQVGT